MKKRVLCVALLMCLLMGTLSPLAQEALAAGYETAWFPAPTMKITQIAYESYSHSDQNAIDFETSGDVFAPFTGKIVQMDKRYGFVLLQSVNKVYYADGTLDYMTVGFMHDSDISNLKLKQIIPQGQGFYQPGGMSSGNPNKYKPHVHLAIRKGKVNYVSRYSTGNKYAFQALTINRAKTAITSSSKLGKVAKNNRVVKGTYTNWANLWKYTNTSSTQKTYPTISGANVPGSLKTGQSYSIKGTISSPTKMTSVRAGVYTSQSGGTWKTGAVVNPGSTSYNLANLARYVGFQKLGAGTYYYRVTAKNSAGTATLINQKFTVSNAAAAPSYATISGANAPTTLNPEQTYSIKGTISSTTKITSVTAGIYTSSAGTNMVNGTTVRPNTTTYDLKNIDRYVYFNRLRAGTYYYRVTATNAAGTRVLINQKFTVNDSIAGAWCTISPKCAPQARLDVYGGGNEDGTNVQIYAANGTLAQKWRLVDLRNGYYAIQSAVSSHAMCLDVEYGGTESGTNVWLYTWNSSDAQQWKLVNAGGGYYYICPRENQSLCLHVAGGGSANGTNIQVYKRNNSNSQKWRFV